MNKQKGHALLIVLIIAAAIGGYLVSSGKINLNQYKATPSSTTDASPAPNGAGETANWKTYTNTQVGYSLKYPDEFELEATDQSVFFYRKDTNINAKHPNTNIYVYGMVINFRYFDAHEEYQSRPTEQVSINGYPGIRWTDNLSLHEDIWIKNPNKKNSVRIGIDTRGEKNPYNEEDFKKFQQILSTFKFQ